MNADKIKIAKVQAVLLDGREHSLNMNLNALCELEIAYKPFNEVLDELISGSMVALRWLIWAALLDENEDLTVKEAGELIHPAMLEYLTVKINQAIANSLPDGTENPKKPEAGTAI